MLTGIVHASSLCAQASDGSTGSDSTVVQSPFFVHVKPRTNLAYWLAATPNIGFELHLTPESRWTLGANVGYNAWSSQPLADSHAKLRHVLAAAEVRRWNRRSFWGADAVWSHYNAGMVHLPLGLYPSIHHQYKQGDLAAIGLFGGRSWRISSLLRVEAEAGLAWGYADYKRHDCDGCYRGDGKRGFLAPKLAVNLVLDPQKRQPGQQPSQQQ